MMKDKKTDSLAKWDLFTQLKIEYSNLLLKKESEHQKLELELRLWNLLNHLSDKELLNFPETDREWRENFLETKKNEFLFQELDRQKTTTSPQEIQAGFTRAVQHGLSQKGVMGGILKHFLGWDKSVTQGFCPRCKNKFTSDQINQFQAGEMIICKQCQVSMSSTPGGDEQIEEIIETLEDKGEVLSPEELRQRGIFLNEREIDNLKKLQTSKPKKNVPTVTKPVRTRSTLESNLPIHKSIDPEEAKILKSIKNKIGYKVANGHVILLDLCDQSLSVLPETIARLTYLNILYLSGNQLKYLPDSIWELNSLTWLDLRDNQFSSLPEGIGNLTNLKWLDLGGMKGNQFSTLPESISQLKKLENLGLVNNQFSSIPESIFHLPNLKGLFLSTNQISTLSNSIKLLTNLTTLDIGFNQLSCLPESIGKLKKLETLCLWNNQLTNIPESITKLVNLKTLMIDNNMMLEIPSFLGSLKKLTQLSITNNPSLGERAQNYHGSSLKKLLSKLRKEDGFQIA